MSSGVSHSCDLDLPLLWLWYTLASAAVIWPLAWELPYVIGTALKRQKKKKQKQKKTKRKKKKLKQYWPIFAILVAEMTNTSPVLHFCLHIIKLSLNSCPLSSLSPAFFLLGACVFVFLPMKYDHKLFSGQPLRDRGIHSSHFAFPKLQLNLMWPQMGEAWHLNDPWKELSAHCSDALNSDISKKSFYFNWGIRVCML